MTSLRTLLAGAVDYAGLFPPAQLDMESAVRNFAAYRAGEHAWALGRFIVPASRLAEFERVLVNTSKGEGWCVSALAGSFLDEGVAAVFGFNKRQRAIVDTLELKASTVEEVHAAARTVPSLLTGYVEIPLEPDPSLLVAAIGKSGLRAKARTGGITADAFPASAALARFIRACVAANVPFKATAGLHHPLRATYRLTYEPNSPTGMMYGFLNIFVAAAVALKNGNADDVVGALEELSPTAFQFSNSEILWRTYRVDIAGITSLRSERVISFGSCSFTEPIEDLKTLNVL
jgi:hypothetical protein